MSLKFEHILKECPFCGSHRVYLVTGKRKFDRVQCDYCGATGPWFDGHPEDAISDWNNRSYEAIEDVLIDWFKNDDSHVVDSIVSVIRKKLSDPTFARGACFDDEREKPTPPPDRIIKEGEPPVKHSPVIYGDHLCVPELNGQTCKICHQEMTKPEHDFWLCKRCGAQLPDCLCPPEENVIGSTNKDGLVD